ncbi:MAG: MarR family transcriptional regulator [Clostridiales bacterium]|nr:MarR family transcriptional regulator [Clostridiales bacterium]
MNDTYTELYEKLSRLEWLLHRQHLRSHAEHGPLGDPTRGQGRVLAILKMKPEISMKDLSYLLAIRHQSLNELLNKLERNGFITRIPSETDKRSVLVCLTEKGKNEQYLDMGSEIFGCLSAEEQALFGEYLDRVIAVLEERLGVTPGAEIAPPYDDGGPGPFPPGPGGFPQPPHGPHFHKPDEE